MKDETVASATGGGMPAGERERLADTARWFLRSGIIEESGGVARYYRGELKQNARVSTEITGYAVSTLLDLHERLGDAPLLEAARRSGDFLCDRAWDDSLGAMPFEWTADGGAPENATYFFDCGIIVRGLLRLWRRTGGEEYLRTALKCGESMRRDFWNGTDIDPILELPGKTPRARDQRWSRSSDCYQLKSALGWLDLFEATGDSAWEEEYERALRLFLPGHLEFLGKEPGERVMDRLHAYGYFLEALVPRASRPDVREALATGIGLAARELRRVRPAFERSDASAQLLRVRILAEACGAVPMDEEAAAEEASFASRYFLRDDDPRLRGGYRFGSRGGEMSAHINPVSSGFCCQALAMWADRASGRRDFDWRALV